MEMQRGPIQPRQGQENEEEPRIIPGDQEELADSSGLGVSQVPRTTPAKWERRIQVRERESRGACPLDPPFIKACTSSFLSSGQCLVSSE